MKYNAKKKEASQFTRQKNEELAERLHINLREPFCEDYELAKSHRIKNLDHFRLEAEDGRVVWDLEKYDFFKEKEIPPSVNPSLWLNGKSNYEAGVFSVVGRDIIQVRGLDIANLTAVRSKTGWILVDVMTNMEAARAALCAMEDALGEPVRSRIRAVIISHSHTDHFGGIRGVVDEENVGQISEGKIPIYVPAGFEDATIDESLYAGAAMNRRCDYQFARSETPGVYGTVSTGIGLGYGKGTATYIKPTNFIDCDQTLEIDGLKVDFQLTPGTEAPAEMNNYFHDYRALWMAENCCGTLHNLYPIRGAKVRDAKEWARYINDALQKYGDSTDVIFQSHNWPHWNTEENPQAVKEYLRNNVAIYKFIHDQTLMYANMGYTPREIARKLEVPAGLQKFWYIRPYYGSLEVNSRAVYQRYLGYYDGNPVNLIQLPDEEEARKFVEYVGGEEAVLLKAADDYAKGEYQFAAEAANKVVFVNPDNMEARYLCADALEQLAYQIESAILRNAYLAGATELRVKKHQDPVRDANTLRNLYGKQIDLINSMECFELLDYLGIIIDSNAASEKDLEFILKIKGKNEKQEIFLIHLYNGVLLYYPQPTLAEKDTCLDIVEATKEALIDLVWKNLDKMREDGITDEKGYLTALAQFIVRFADDAAYAIIEP